ncbi:cytochrome oxidase assembly protein ShyY1 [Ornithinicoccus hortensis]|uniref:SURF1-like protein n=2 Tax=Ornithinicoccus hortensis TaxID=82346 RepID=A0A542YSQ0_9MICO|nr:cytochrome oxidase assembly protein ShyY1 [Ornithinicoccus hortensis]
MSRQWAGALALAAVFAVVAVLLGNWQYSKHVDKTANRDRVAAHYDAEPRPLGDTVDLTEPVTQAEEWTRVTATGSYRAQDQLMVRNRPFDGTFGYEVLVPFVPDDGSPAVLVNRGWLANAEDASTLPEVPPPPEGTATVTGWLRPGEPDLGRDLPAGQLASINVAGAQAAIGPDLPLLDGYLVLGEESPEVERPVPIARPRTDLGPHLAYAIQWWFTSPIGFVMVVVFARRDYLDAQAQERTATDGTPVPARPKKVRIWDEEDG